MKLYVKLASVLYTGKIGREWSLNVSVGGSSYMFNKYLNNTRSNKINKTIFEQETGNSGSLSLSTFVFAVEKDKYPDTGFNNGDFAIDLSLQDEEQEYTLTVMVMEDNGPKKKSKETGTLKFRFIAVVAEADEGCMDPGIVVAEPKVQNDLTNAAMNRLSGQLKKPAYGWTVVTSEDSVIKGCLYRAGKDWKVRAIEASQVVHWGVNTSAFQEVVLPDPANGIRGNINCKNVNYIIFLLELRIRFEDVKLFLSQSLTTNDGVYDANEYDPAANPAAPKKPYYSYAACAAHEQVHVRERSEQIQTTWPQINKDIDAHIIGSVDVLSEKEARKKMNDFLLKKRQDWGKLLIGIKVSHQAAFTQSAIVLKELVAKMKIFENNCPQE